MERIPVSLLTISVDPDLVKPPTQSPGDAYDRQLKYAGILEQYHAITFVKRAVDLKPLQPAPNFAVYPVGSRSLLWFVRDAVRLGDQLCRAQRIDAISTQDPFFTALIGYRLKRKCGLPLSIQSVADQVDNPYWLAERRVYPVMNWLARWLIHRADTFRVNSIEQKERLALAGAPRDRIWNLPMMIELGPFLNADGSALRRDLLGDQFDRLILFMGRLTPQKDIPTLLQAIPRVSARHPRTRWVLVGDGGQASALRQQAERMSLADRVLFTGAVAYADTPAYLAACDFFVLPSSYEGSARVLALAAAAGKPIIATRVSGTSDLVSDGETGYVTPVGDAAALANRMQTLLDNPTQAIEMGRKARSRALDVYDEQRILRGFQELWVATAGLRK